MKRHAIRLMDETNSFEYTKQYLRKVESEALDEIRRLGGNPLLEGVIRQLSVPISEA